MNSIWNKNIQLFVKRFPSLAANLNICEDTPELPEKYRFPFEVLNSRQKIPGTENFYPTAKENGKFLHSAYNPLREGEQAAESGRSCSSEIYGCAFFGCGLGYTILAYARNHPQDTIILVEWNPACFLTALSLLDWSDFFAARNVILAVNASPDTVISILEQCGGFSHIAISENKNQTEHAQEYFQALHSLIERNKRKKQLNNSTLEKFSGLWLKNSCRNINQISALEGVNIYKNKIDPAIPALILAAGPTLETVLPHLNELKKRTVIIAVDTALRACLKAGVEPDFIILADPQYYAWRHIAGLSSPSSILITESAAYPSVFHFNCRKIVMCSSLFPLGQYIESKTRIKGALSAGGSVSTTAWDFARLAGFKQILFSGLDLGYPDYQTHIRGSTFEEKIHTVSTRLSTAEKNGIASLFGANMEKDTDYSGKPILTDNRMKMFAWWFESKQEEFSSHGIQSYTLSPSSLKIPGFKVTSVQEVLKLKEITEQKKEFLNITEGDTKELQEKFNSTMKELKNGLEELYSTARKGLHTAEEALQNRQNIVFYLNSLEKTDSQIMQSQFKEIASLIFPTEKQLNQIFSESNLSEDKMLQSIQKSKIIYKQLMQSIRNYQTLLFE